MVIFKRDTATRPNNNQGDHNQKKMVERWIDDVMAWPVEKLIEIPFGRGAKGTPGIYQYASHCLRISVASLRRWPEIFEPLQQRLIDSGCFHPDYSAYANEYNRRLNLLLRKCDHDDYPYDTPTATRMKIKQDAGIPRYPNNGVRSLTYATINAYFEERKKADGLSDTRKPTVRRRQVDISEDARRKDQLVKDLRAKPILSSQDIVTGTESDPLLPFKHLFYEGTINTCYGRVEFDTYIAPYLEHITVVANTDLGDVFHTYAMTRFKKFQEENVLAKRFSTRAANFAIAVFRLLVKRYARLLDIHEFKYIDVIGFKNARTTDQRTPYSKEERNVLLAAIEKHLDETDRRQLVVSDTERHDLEPLFKPLQKIIVEEMDGCFALRNKTATAKFAIECARIGRLRSKNGKGYDGSVRGVALEAIGALPEVDSLLMFVYVMKLAAVTGMNREAVVDLELDDFVWSHPATGKPCIRYWKARALGEKRLHLDLVDAELQWMTFKQGKEVKALVDKVATLTKPLRKHACDSNRNRLFIFRQARKQNTILVRSFRDCRSYDERAAMRFVQQHGLTDRNGDALNINISKFRATFVSEHIEAGVSIREMQLLLGHRYIATTIDYLDRMDFDRFARNKVDEALKRIHAKCLTSSQQSSCSDSELSKRQLPSTAINSGLVACANIMDPPEFIKMLPNYVAGKPCSLFNKCLMCDNCLITKEHLPQLFAQQREFLNLMHNPGIMNTPYYRVIRENTILLGEILGEESEFSKEELDEAELLSRGIDLSNGALM